MIQGTTPKHTFNIPFDTSMIDKVRILYAQNDNLVVVKTKEDCEITDKAIITTLTQEDTFKFDKNTDVEIQIRILTKGGDAPASIPIKVGVTKCLETEVIV